MPRNRNHVVRCNYGHRVIIFSSFLPLDRRLSSQETETVLASSSDFSECCRTRTHIFPLLLFCSTFTLSSSSSSSSFMVAISSDLLNMKTVATAGGTKYNRRRRPAVAVVDRFPKYCFAPRTEILSTQKSHFILVNCPV